MAKKQMNGADGIDDLHVYLGKLTNEQIKALALKCGTTAGQLSNIRYRTRNCAAWLAINLDRETKGALNMQRLCPNEIDWSYVKQRLTKAKI